VASWLTAQPAWLVIQAPAQPGSEPSDQELEKLGAGEREAQEKARERVALVMAEEEDGPPKEPST